MTDARFPELTFEQMTPEQRKAAEAITSGPRGRLAGPMNAWLRSPDLADRFQRVGEYIRFKSSIPTHLNEFAILITAREWTAQFEWYAHHKMAMDAGLNPALAEAVAEGRRPADMQEDERIVYDFCTELYRDKNVSDKTYSDAKARFGEQGIVDLIGASGYYTAVSMTLNVANVGLPPGEEPPLKPLKR
jgi:4-carboxymuconolactone decarboxylase